MKKIICNIATLGSGGAEHQMVELIRMLCKKGYEVELLNRIKTEDHYDLSCNIKRHYLNVKGGNVRLFVKYFLFFITHRCDTIISFEQRENAYMLPAFFLIPRKKTRVICSERNLTYGNPSQIEKLLLRLLYKRADYIVPNSYSQKKHIEELAPNLSSKLVTITNYTDLTKYVPHKETNSKGNEAIKIGIFCRYNPQKNYDRFAQSVAILKQQIRLPFLIDWYGNMEKGQNPYYQEFSRLCVDLGISDVLHLHDAVRNVESVMPYYNAICVPSIYEGFCNSIAEAICCGLPVLAGDVSDNSVMVKDSQNGYLFDPHDVNSMTLALKKFIELPTQEVTLMGQKSRSLAEKLFDANDFINKYIQLIEG